MGRDFAVDLLQLVDAAIAGRPIASRRTSPLLVGFANVLEQTLSAWSQAPAASDQGPPTASNGSFPAALSPPPQGEGMR